MISPDVALLVMLLTWLWFAVALRQYFHNRRWLQQMREERLRREEQQKVRNV
jgi:hypothetical protein